MPNCVGLDSHLKHRQTHAPSPSPETLAQASPVKLLPLPTTTTRTLSLTLAQPRRLDKLLLAARSARAAALALHLPGVESRQVARAGRVARLAVALLAAKAVLSILLGALGVDAPAALLAATTALAVLVELVVDADVEEVGFFGEVVVAVLGALW